MRCTWPARNDLRSTADIRHALIGRLGSGLERIVVGDEEDLALDPSAMDFDHLVHQDGCVVVHLPLEDGALGNLEEFRSDLDVSSPCKLGSELGTSRTLATAITSGCHHPNGDQQASLQWPGLPASS